MKVFVTGGGGFLGFAIVKQLLAAGYEVVSYSRRRYEALEELSVVQYQGDLSDYNRLKTALQGCEAVFHVAAKAGIWGHYASFYDANVAGTNNIINACREQGIRYLVYTSSASVCYGRHSGLNDESLPYPKTFDAHYPKTKALAEQAVMAANDANLATCSLRPHLIWGPGDPHLLPRFLSRQQKGQLRILGKGDHLIDITYVDNAALAHLQAFHALRQRAPVAGKAYFLSQDEPITVRAFINLLLHAGGLPPVRKTMNPRFALIIAWWLERVYRFLRLQSEPLLTTFVAKQLSSSHWYDISAAKRDFGYQPTVTTEEGMKRLAAWLKTSNASVAAMASG